MKGCKQPRGYSKSTFTRNFQFLTPFFPCSFLFVLHVQPPSKYVCFTPPPSPPTPLKKSSVTLMILISNKKSGGEKREKN